MIYTDICVHVAFLLLFTNQNKNIQLI